MRFQLTTPTEFQNNHIALKIERLPGCLIRANIEVAPIASKAAYSKALRNIKKEVVIPGFRKGKAPDNIILKSFAKNIDREWEQVLVDNAIQEAISLAKLHPNGREALKKVQVKALSQEEPSHIVVELELMPEVPHVDPSNLKLEAYVDENSFENEYDKEMETLKLSHADWKELGEKAIEEGDYAALDITDADDENTKYCENQKFHVKNGLMANWLYQILLGKKVNETFEVTSEPNKELGEEGEAKKCLVTVKSVLFPELPQEDDALAQKCKTETIDNLKEKVRSKVENARENRKRVSLIRQVRDQLIENYPFDLPHSKQGLLGVADEHERLWLMAQKVAVDQKIQVTEAELNQALYEHWMQLAMQGNKVDSPEAFAEDEHFKLKLYVNILMEKALGYLVDAAKK